MAPEIMHQARGDAECAPDLVQPEPEQGEEVIVECLDLKALVHPEYPLALVPLKPSKVPVEIAFSASAGAFLYQMGIAAYMQDHFDLSNCHFSGSSGGSWPASVLAAGGDIRASFELIKQKRYELVQGKTYFWSGYFGHYANIINAVVHEMWKDDPDAIHRMEAHGLSIATTRFPSMKAERQTSWTDIDDLAESILSSCMIPFALSGKPCITHNGGWCIDAGFSNFKGVNCDDYSTMADLTYHGVNLMFSAARGVNTRLASWFFPSLTMPIARLVNRALPTLESPHTGIAPHSNKCVQLDPESSKDRPRVLVTPWNWRNVTPMSFHLTLDMDKHTENFNQGYLDATEHHAELAALLPPRHDVVVPSTSI